MAIKEIGISRWAVMHERGREYPISLGMVDRSHASHWMLRGTWRCTYQMNTIAHHAHDLTSGHQAMTDLIVQLQINGHELSHLRPLPLALFLGAESNPECLISISSRFHTDFIHGEHGPCMVSAD